jgi:hypothetical protein
MTPLKFLAIIAGIFFVLIVAPLVLITGLNYLGLAIPFTLETWLGGAFILMVVRLMGMHSS